MKNTVITRRVHGASMIEVLVSILIVSLGVLGTAGLQAAALKANVSSSQRSAATMLAYEMADRMRANLAGVNLNYYHNYLATQQATCLSTAGCTSQQMAQNDAYEWNQLIQNVLPGGQGIVCIDSSPDDGETNASMVAASCDGQEHTYAIKIWWPEDRTANTTNRTAAGIKRVVIVFKP